MLPESEGAGDDATMCAAALCLRFLLGTIESGGGVAIAAAAGGDDSRGDVGTSTSMDDF